jgi:hypothetical protein
MILGRVTTTLAVRLLMNVQLLRDLGRDARMNRRDWR